MTSGGRVYAWCGCRDPRTGRRLGAACPRRGEPGHGSWYVSLELPALPGSGRRRIRRGGFGSEQAARAALAQLQMPAVGAGGPGGPPVTTGQWLARWLETRTRPRYSTMRNYRAHARLYLTPCLGQILLADLTPAHVQVMLTAVALRRAAEGRPVGAGTLARIRATLRAALNAAIRAGHLADNPASKAELPAVPRARPVVWTSARIAEWQRTGVRPAVAVWTPAQTAAFLNAARGERLYAAFHVIALRGLRRGEAAGLRWCDLDLDNGTAVIAQQLQQYDGQIAAARSRRPVASAPSRSTKPL